MRSAGDRTGWYLFAFSFRPGQMYINPHLEQPVTDVLLVAVRGPDSPSKWRPRYETGVGRPYSPNGQGELNRFAVAPNDRDIGGVYGRPRQAKVKKTGAARSPKDSLTFHEAQGRAQ